MIYPMKGYNYTGETPKGWIMAEKLDGIRAIWDGSQLWSKQGNAINAPEIAAKLPQGIALDGELWAGRERFERVLSALKSGDWPGVEFVAFDLIDTTMPAIARRKALDALSVRSVSYELCQGKRHLRKFEDAIKAKGGEGVMIQKPSAKYQHGRTTDLQKVKSVDVSEVAVSGWNGKSLDVMVGKLEFKVAMGAKPHHAKSKTAFVSHYGLTVNGIPRHAALLA